MDVEAIEEGKIVRVSEQYARLEGLMIIKKRTDNTSIPVYPVPLVQLRRAERKAKPQIEEFRRPLDYRKNNVLQDLVENFQWVISKKRREKNLSRRQLAQMIGEVDETIASLENGFLPKDNFVLLSKVEKALDINLRKSAISNSYYPQVTLSKENVNVDKEKKLIEEVKAKMDEPQEEEMIDVANNESKL